MRKRKRGQGLQGKAEDADGLAPVKDNCAALRLRRTPCGYNAAMQFLDR